MLFSVKVLDTITCFVVLAERVFVLVCVEFGCVVPGLCGCASLQLVD